jgi:hypothetical protein
MFRTVSCFLIGVLIAFSAAVSLADDDSKKLALIQSLQDMAKNDVSIDGAVSDAETPDNEEGPFGKLQMAATRTATSAMNMSADLGFTGKFECFITSNQHIAFLSEEKLPQIKFFSTPNQTLFTQTFEGQPPNSSLVAVLVSRLLDWKQMADGLRDSTRIRESSQNGTTILKVVLDSEILSMPSMIEAMQAKMMGGNRNVRFTPAVNPLSPSVIDYALQFRVNDQGKLLGMTVNLQFDDPLKEMLKQGAKGVQVVPRNLLPGKKAKVDKESLVLGKLVTFEFEIKEKPSEQLLLYVDDAKSKLAK